MAVSPQTGARLAASVTAIVADYELLIMRRVAAAVAADTTDPDWELHKLLALPALRARIEADLRAMNRAVSAEVISVLRRAYLAGRSTAAGDMQQ